jgi:hypothetical protein
MSEKSLATDGASFRMRVITGKATAPPPSEVAPPMKDPMSIVTVIGKYLGKFAK